MNTRTKKTLLILAIILLVVINISALLTIIYNNKIQSKQSSPIEENNLKNEIEVRGMYSFLKDELKLSDNQYEQFQNINRNNMIKSQEIAMELNNKRRDMMTEIAKKNPNPEILDNYAYEIGTLHYELKKQTINHFLELKKICNEEQQESLQKLFMQLLNDQDGFRRNPRERGRNRHGRSQQERN